jgi:hypothetical protein
MLSAPEPHASLGRRRSRLLHRPARVRERVGGARDGRGDVAIQWLVLGFVILGLSVVAERVGWNLWPELRGSTVFAPLALAAGTLLPTAIPINLRSGIVALAQGMGGVFVLVFPLRAGVPVPATLCAMALIVGGRFVVRPASRRGRLGRRLLHGLSRRRAAALGGSPALERHVARLPGRRRAGVPAAPGNRFSPRSLAGPTARPARRSAAARRRGRAARAPSSSRAPGAHVQSTPRGGTGNPRSKFVSSAMGGRAT